MGKLPVPAITVGADPELFLYRRAVYPISAVGLIGGTKQHPAPLGKPGFFVQEDGVALEFNVPPVSDVVSWVGNMEWAMNKINDTAMENGYEAKAVASEIFPQEELSSPESQVFGCDPDYNAWTREVNPRPMSPNPRLRAAGGHVHVGWPEAGPLNLNELDPFRCKVIKCMDLRLGVPSVIMDMDSARKMLYGKAGAHRQTSYGVEYRTMSNFWLKHKAYMKWVFEETKAAYDMACNPDSDEILEKVSLKLQTAINHNVREIARAIMKDYDLAAV